jgi:hypothetical protein
VYCVRDEDGGDVGAGNEVAVNANVGGGVFVGGSDVKVGINVGDSSAVGVNVTGWNGVGVGDAFGLGVTVIREEGGVCPCGNAQEERKNTSRKKFNRRDNFITTQFGGRVPEGHIETTSASIIGG